MDKILNCINGSKTGISNNFLDVQDPSTGELISEVILSNTEDFNNTMNYYASQPEELQGIYDAVLESLSEMEVALVDVKMDQDAISPLGKKQIVDVISQLPIARIFKEPSYSSDQTKDSLFKYIASNISLFDSLPYNIESFQKSYIGLTFNQKRYLSFREEVRVMLDSIEKN